MALVFDQMTVESQDPKSLGRWWAEALGWVVVFEDDEDLEIRPTKDGGVSLTPSIYFLPLAEAKPSGGRLMFDFRPDDQKREVERLLALGARRVDRGERVETYVVFADPEGNEFCVLKAKEKAPAPTE